MRHPILILIILGMLASMGVQAARYNYYNSHSRGSSFEIGIGGGYGSLGYQSREMSDWSNSVSGRPSGYVHAAYNYFFSEYVGLSLGVDFTRYGSGLRFNGKQTWTDVVDTDDFLGLGTGEKYDHTLTINNWQEIQSISYVEIPLSIKFSAPAGNIYVIGEVGVKAGIPVLSTYQGGGSLTHTGYYEPWQLTLHDMDEHGFYTETNYHPSGTLEHKELKWSVFAKLGVAIPLVDQLDLTVQAFGQYAFTGNNVGGERMPGFRDDRAGFADAHYFMESYSSTIYSPLAQGMIKPWHVGLEIGIRYTIPHARKSPCRCLN